MTFLASCKAFTTVRVPTFTTTSLFMSTPKTPQPNEYLGTSGTKTIDGYESLAYQQQKSAATEPKLPQIQQKAPLIEKKAPVIEKKAPVTEKEETMVEQEVAVAVAEEEVPEPEFPKDFMVTDKWSYLTPKQRACELSDIPAQVAFQCVNKRGAIAHARDTELNYDVITMESNPFTTVEEVFDDLGGTKEIKGVDNIKRELMTRGPVVSTSFILTEDFMSNPENNIRFDPGLLNKKYPVLIIGWQHTSFGEVWVIQPLVKGRYADFQMIAFRQYGIDDKCIAPVSDFEDKTWQSGPYFDIDMSDWPFPEWCNSWKGVMTNITSAELETLGDTIGEDLITAANSKTRFVIRDKSKIAHSRACFLTRLTKEEGSKPWNVDFTYTN